MKARKLFKNSLKFFIIIFFIGIIINGCSKKEIIEDVSIDNNQVSNNSALKNQQSRAIPLRWAPIHYQDVDKTGSHALQGKSDYITKINFDDDWNATNNWNNIVGHDAYAYCYFSFSETSTHWYVIYAFFHPRDWSEWPWGIDEHENDLEGFLAIIKRDGSNYGDLQAIITVFHNDFYSYIPYGSPLQENNNQTIDGVLSFEEYNEVLHPKTAQECRGHGLKAWPYCNINKGDDGIKYYPSNIADKPQHPNDRFVRYALLDIFNDINNNSLSDQYYNTDLFTAPGSGIFKSSHGYGNAHAPWMWDDWNDGPTNLAGEIATDPVKITQYYFKNLGDFSTVYTINPYDEFN